METETNEYQCGTAHSVLVAAKEVQSRSSSCSLCSGKKQKESVRPSSSIPLQRQKESAVRLYSFEAAKRVRSQAPYHWANRSNETYPGFEPGIS